MIRILNRAALSRTMPSETKNQFSLTGTALSTSGRAKSDFLSVQSSPATSPSWDFSRIPLHPISRPGDAAECEADAMAGRALSNTLSSTAGAAAGIQRRATSENSRGSTVAASAIASRLAGGRPLDLATRDYFEPRFGVDFRHVRVHDHSEAHQAAAGISAKAFTVGQNIAFANGEYAPGTEAGLGVIAHELAHTIQQRTEPAPAGVFRAPIPGWNFKPSDYARRQEAGQDLTIASDSSFFPAKLQENLLKTLKYVLGPAIMPPATEGINAMDLFHGHLVVKKDPATEKDSKAAAAKGDKFAAELKAARTKALGGEVKFSKGYPLTDKNIGAYKAAVEKVLPSFGTLLDEGAKVPGAAIMYHTFEFNQPSDLKAKGQTLKPEDSRRHYVTPLDTNRPRQYSPPSGGYESEYTIITSFSFLADDKGAVHVRPMDASTGFTTLELSTITGTTFPEPLEFEK
jgi:hypothetical protein